MMKYYLNIKFHNGGKTYYFATDDEYIKDGDLVVVETIVGQELGIVFGEKGILSNLDFALEVKPILRKATKDDIKQYKNNYLEAQKVKLVFEKHASNLNLNMNLIDAMYTLDKTKILFTYVSEERVDFRELLKELANELHCRIELKQVNSRERAQITGGYGQCGRPLCCTTFINKFDSISLNRAKNQMLSINIPKLSGVCGKLMCCLKFEDDIYTEEKKKFPPLGTKITLNDNEYKLTSYNILNKVMKFESSDDTQFLEYEEAMKYIKQSGKFPANKNGIKNESK